MIDPDGYCHAINLIRAETTGPFEAADVALAHMLLPHLQHSADGYHVRPLTIMLLRRFCYALR
jgi:hypothetical protein